jgi:hypothetical protein
VTSAEEVAPVAVVVKGVQPFVVVRGEHCAAPARFRVRGSACKVQGF